MTAVSRASASSPTVPTGVPAMEDLFVRSTRLRMLIGDERRYANYEGEFELTAQGQETFANGEWKWATFLSFLRGKITWLAAGILCYSGRYAHFGRNAIGYYHILDVQVSGTLDLQIWASPETTQAARAAACDLLLPGLSKCTKPLSF